MKKTFICNALLASSLLFAFGAPAHATKYLFRIPQPVSGFRPPTANISVATTGLIGPDTYNSLTAIPSGGMLATGTTSSAGDANAGSLIVRYSAAGDIQWQVDLSSPSYYAAYTAGAVGSDGSLFALSLVCPAGSFLTSCTTHQLTKFSGSGAVVWQRGLSGASFFGPGQITVDSIGNVYLIRSEGTGFASGNLTKYDSNGNLLWKTTFAPPCCSSYTRMYGVAVDSANNIVVSGGEQNAFTPSASAPIVLKFNASGAVIWQRKFQANHAYNNEVSFLDAKVDSAANIYTVGYGSLASGNEMLIAKFSSAGALQWYDTLGGTSDGLSALTVDPAGRIYVTGGTSDSANVSQLYTAQFTNTGGMAWQSVLGVGGGVTGKGLALGTTGRLFTAGSTSALTTFANLPTDGAGFGVAGPFTYAAGTLGVTNPVVTSTNLTYSSQASSQSAVAPLLNARNVVLPPTLYP